MNRRPAVAQSVIHDQLHGAHVARAEVGEVVEFVAKGPVFEEGIQVGWSHGAQQASDLCTAFLDRGV